MAGKTGDLDPLVARVMKKRVKEGLSLRAVASMCGIGFATLARLERGVGQPDQGTMVRLERWLERGEKSVPRSEARKDTLESQIESLRSDMDQRFKEVRVEIAALGRRL